MVSMTIMKLPRWVMLTLITLMVAAVAASLVLWVTWPDHTARRFLRLIADGRFDDANNYMEQPAHWLRRSEDWVTFTVDGNRFFSEKVEVWQSWLSESELLFQPRSLEDFALSRRKFKNTDVKSTLVAERGFVSLEIDDYAEFRKGLVSAGSSAQRAQQLKLTIQHFQQLLSQAQAGPAPPAGSAEATRFEKMKTQLKQYEGQLANLERDKPKTSRAK